MVDESHPVLLTREELRFEIMRGLQQVRASIWRDAKSRNSDLAERGYDRLVAVMLARFDDLKVYRRAGHGPPASPPNWKGER